jgi:hypothetical protein
LASWTTGINNGTPRFRIQISTPSITGEGGSTKFDRNYWIIRNRNLSWRVVGTNSDNIRTDSVNCPVTPNQ